MNCITNCEKTRQLISAQCPWNNHFPGPRKEEEINLESLRGEWDKGASKRWGKTKEQTDAQYVS